MKRWLSILIVVCVLLTASSLKAEEESTLPKSHEESGLGWIKNNLFMVNQS